MTKRRAAPADAAPHPPDEATRPRPWRDWDEELAPRRAASFIGSVQFNATVKSDPTGRLRGTYQCTPTTDGLLLARNKQDLLVIPRGTNAVHAGSNRVCVEAPGGTLVLAVSMFRAYRGRLAAAVAAHLRGERELTADAELKVERFLLVPAVLPLGVVILARGGALWAALGGIATLLCLALARTESLPRAARLGLIVLLNIVLYAGAIALSGIVTWR